MMSVCLFQRGFKLREKLAFSYIGQPLPGSIHLLPSTPQIKGLHTFIRNKDTPRDEFIFYSKRLIRLVIEYTLSLLPFKVSYTQFKGITRPVFPNNFDDPWPLSSYLTVPLISLFVSYGTLDLSLRILRYPWPLSSSLTVPLTPLFVSHGTLALSLHISQYPWPLSVSHGTLDLSLYLMVPLTSLFVSHGTLDLSLRISWYPWPLSLYLMTPLTSIFVSHGTLALSLCISQYRCLLSSYLMVPLT
jgi:hypothetical protein